MSEPDPHADIAPKQRTKSRGRPAGPASSPPPAARARDKSPPPPPSPRSALVAALSEFVPESVANVFRGAPPTRLLRAFTNY